MKSQRHKAIVQIMEDEFIDTQEKLRQALEKNGFKVTQATLSRDIKELALIKTMTQTGEYRYSVPSLKKRDMQRDNSKLFDIISDGVISVDSALNTVAVKCHTGMAQAVCAKLDCTKIENVVGTIAGDDTIFILMRTVQDAQRLVKEIELIIDGNL